MMWSRIKLGDTFKNPKLHFVTFFRALVIMQHNKTLKIKIEKAVTK